jgi:hypothetical protein
MRDVRGVVEPSCREPGIQTHGGSDQEPSGLPRVPRLGSRSYLPGQPSQIVDLESRGVSQRGAIQIIR